MFLNVNLVESMIKDVKFVYVMIIFLSLFLVAMSIDDSHCPHDICPFHLKPKCIFTKVVGQKFFSFSLDGKCGCM
ncbi:Nodule Cysteine-Rich (NCR) secreted peptide [Medicago truncatula]|uniref:Nodule Cysteine-Rich (NCR) secreted peptide n=1 Tax=Medicago truncatula TaxID=3880 RepID=G7JUV6_MEDTR|nr:Nodule Cysteine-Rich (NCR) secreted peptide [Medicago truncatula]